jgi:hypothetical protein
MKYLGWLLCGVFVVAGFALAGPVAAQTKKKTVRKPVAQPSAVTPAEVYSNESQRIIEGTNEPLPRPTPPEEQPTPETADEKLDRIGKTLEAMAERLKALEGRRDSDADEKRKRLLLNLDILTKAEQRAESLRKQVYEIVEKENTIKTRLEQLEIDLRPEMIDRQVAFAGTLRPEELREIRRKNLDVERRNLQALLAEIQAARANLETNVVRADQLVEKLRARLEKDIDDALSDEPN